MYQAQTYVYFERLFTLFPPENRTLPSWHAD